MFIDGVWGGGPRLTQLIMRTWAEGCGLPPLLFADAMLFAARGFTETLDEVIFNSAVRLNPQQFDSSCFLR